MKFPLILRSTHEAELDRAINIITEKNRVIAVNKDELAVANRTKTILQDRNERLNEALVIAEGKVKKLEGYIEKLEQVSENKTLRNCSLNTKLVSKDAELEKLAEDILDAEKINKNEIASYLLEIAKYMGGGEPIDIHINEEFEM